MRQTIERPAFLVEVRAAWKVTMVEVNERKLEAGRLGGITVNGIRQESLSLKTFARCTPTEDTILLTLLS
jgi:hypothetical protein